MGGFVAGNNRRGSVIGQRLAVGVGDDAPRLGYNESPCAIVPRGEMQLKKQGGTTAGDTAQIQCGRAAFRISRTSPKKVRIISKVFRQGVCDMRGAKGDIEGGKDRDYFVRIGLLLSIAPRPATAKTFLPSRDCR